MVRVAEYGLPQAFGGFVCHLRSNPAESLWPKTSVSKDGDCLGSSRPTAGRPRDGLDFHPTVKPRVLLEDALLERSAALRPSSVTLSPQTQAPPSVSANSDGAERRPITILFCDLAGSTSLAAKLDAEDWRNLVNAYLDETSTAVTSFGGHVLKKLGDGSAHRERHRGHHHKYPKRRLLVQLLRRNGRP